MKQSKYKYALTAGLSLIIMAIAAGFSYGYVYESIVIDTNQTITFKNLVSAKSLFLSGIIGWIIIFISDLLVTWSLYHYLKVVNIKISMLTALTRLIYTAILGIAIYHLFQVFHFTENNSAENISSVSNHLELFEKIWSFGLIIFGLHLVGLGYLTYRSGFVPKIWGGLLYFAGVCYFFIHLAKAIIPMYRVQIESMESVLALPMALSELGLAIWLIIPKKKSKVLTESK